MRQVTARVNSAAERIGWLYRHSVGAQLELHALQTTIGFVRVHKDLVADWFSICNSAVARSADCQSAIQQTNCLRYVRGGCAAARLPICATVSLAVATPRVKPPRWASGSMAKATSEQSRRTKSCRTFWRRSKNAGRSVSSADWQSAVSQVGNLRARRNSLVSRF